MPSAPSPSSTVQAARKALADRLRDIQRDAGLRGRELAALAGWAESKVSRIGSAVMPPSDDDIRVWCRVCGAQDQAADLIAASRAADSAYREWRRVQRTGLRRLQQSTVPLYERTRLFRVYASNVVPGMLQTPDYARALLSAITAFREIPNDVEQAVEARMQRSRVLTEGGHRFRLLVEESVLRHRIGVPDVMAAQLGYLLEAMAMPTVTLGVIPFNADRSGMWPLEAFYMFDDGQVSVETLSAEVTATAPGELALYEKAFAALAGLAVHGAAARSLVAAAVAAL